MFAIVVICIELMLIVEFKHFEKYEIVGMDSGLAINPSKMDKVPRLLKQFFSIFLSYCKVAKTTQTLL